jgi:hypothetical protein
VVLVAAADFPVAALAVPADRRPVHRRRRQCPHRLRAKNLRASRPIRRAYRRRPERETREFGQARTKEGDGMEGTRQDFGSEAARLADGPTFMVRGGDGRLFLAVAVEASELAEGEGHDASLRLPELFRAGRAAGALTAVEVNPAFEAAKQPSRPKSKPQPKPQPAQEPAPESPGLQTETPGLQTDTPGLQTG